MSRKGIIKLQGEEFDIRITAKESPGDVMLFVKRASERIESEVVPVKTKQGGVKPKLVSVPSFMTAKESQHLTPPPPR